MSRASADFSSMPFEVRPIRMREVPALAWVLSRTMEATARDLQKPDGVRRNRLQRVRHTYPPGPLRRYAIFVTYLVSLAVIESWVGRSADDVAAVSVIPLTGPGRFAWRLRAMAVSLPVFFTWMGAFMVVAGLRPSAVIPIGIVFGLGLVLPFLPFLWPAGDIWRNRRGLRVIRLARKTVIADAVIGGRVIWAAGLGSGNRGAGARLAATMAKRADAEGVTVLAVAEEALACIYQRFGFIVQERAAMSWGTQVLLVRRRPSPTR